MPEPELFLLFVRPLNRAGIRYIISGSIAAIFYGEPRLMHDVDFVVFLNELDRPELDQWLGRLALEPQWKEVQSYARPS